MSDDALYFLNANHNENQIKEIHEVQKDDQIIAIESTSLAHNRQLGKSAFS